MPECRWAEACAWVTVSAVLLAGCSESGPSAERYVVNLSGLAEVPPAATNAGGVATFTVEGSAISFALTVQNIVNVTAAHIHQGGATETGNAIVELYGGPTTGVITSETLATGTITAAGLAAISMDSLLALMRTGSAYVNVHTTARPAGEIRGQIRP